MTHVEQVTETQLNEIEKSHLIIRKKENVQEGDKFIFQTMEEGKFKGEIEYRADMILQSEGLKKGFVLICLGDILQ